MPPPSLVEVLSELPPATASFAYGSAVFSQRGYTAAEQQRAMLDLILVVEDAAAWHQRNLERNAAHYSAIGWAAGARGVAALQEHFGAGMYYNHAHVRGRLIKYGLITRAALIDDLEHWRSLYASGRMHKPVQPLQEVPTDLMHAMHSNLRSAVRASLLLLPSRFDDAELYSHICGLSYSGDVRMGVGESLLKPLDIADGQRAALAGLYAQSLAGEATLTPCVGNALTQDVSLAARQQTLSLLPSNVQRGLLQELAPSAGATLSSVRDSTVGVVGGDLHEVVHRLWRTAASDVDANLQLRSSLRCALARIVRRSSLAQTVKGIATAGASTSIAYAVAKMRRRSLKDAHANSERTA